MKKIICILISLIFIFTLVSCNTENTVVVTDPDAGYKIEKEDGNYFLIFDEIYNNKADDGFMGCEYAPFIYFHSVKEMKEKVLNGKLTDEQKEIMSRFPKDEHGKIRIIDFNSLYKPILPSDLDCAGIEWEGYSYSYCVLNKQNIHEGYITLLDKSEYDRDFQYKFIDIIQNNPLVTIIKTETEIERNATIYYCKTGSADTKTIVYKISVPNGELYIKEQYCVSHISDSVECSDTIPQIVTIIGSMNGGYFQHYVVSPSERPGVEWLSQFGIEPLKTE